MKYIVLTLLTQVRAERLFKESFHNFDETWTVSDWKDESLVGSWSTNGSHLMTTEDSKFYTIARNIPRFELFSGFDTFVLQFSVSFPQNTSCAGAYIKLFPTLTNLNIRGGEDETPYVFMFGPDICGIQKTHAIFRYNNTNVGTKTMFPCEKNVHDTFYTFVLHRNGSYRFKIDNVMRREGTLRSDWPFLQPEVIDDPDSTKPNDWVDLPMLDDPNDKKPDGWDDVPSEIADPDASEPEDWSVNDDGEWEPPMVPNPEYEGTWKPKQIANPDYKGEWSPPRIPNPQFVADPSLGEFGEIGSIGFDLWQHTAGTAFSNILIVTTEEEAETDFQVAKKSSQVKDEL